MNRYLGLTVLILLTACASPRYSYYFPRPVSLSDQPAARPDELLLEPREASPLQASSVAVPEVRAPRTRVGWPERRTALGSGPVIKLKTEPDPPEAGSPIKEDPDLRRAIIFAASGLVAIIIGGNVFWVVGGLSLMIGLIFAIKWLQRK